MHLKDATPTHILETKTKVVCEVLNWKSGKIEQVRQKAMIHEWLPGKKNDVTDILQRNRKLILEKFPKAKINAKKKTIDGVEMRAVKSTYPTHNPTHEEIGCHPRHHWFRCEIRNGKKVIVTSILSPSEENRGNTYETAKNHKFFVENQVHPIPKNWVIKPGEYSFIQSPGLTKAEKVVVFEETIQAGKFHSPVCNAFNVQIEDIFAEQFPVFKAKRGKKYSGRHVKSTFLKPPEKILYRMLHWIPGLKIDGCQFYKGNIVELKLANTGAIAQFQFHKKELAVYLWCPSNQIIEPKKPEKQHIISIECGTPGSKSSNQFKPKPEVLHHWNILLKVLKTKTLIYPGNNFQV